MYRSVEDVGMVMVGEANCDGEAQIHVDGGIDLESIGTEDVDALAVIGTVHPPTERLGANCGGVARDRVSGNAESNTWRRAGGDQRIGQTALCSVDGGELPIIR